MAQNPSDKKQDKPAQNRDDRLKAALKANMARRKAQARGRMAQDTGTSEAGEKDS